MKKVNMDWAKAQLEKERVTPETGISVVKLLKFWTTLEHSAKADEKVLEIFSKLSQGVALLQDSEEMWEPARPGFLKVGDTVRVRADAFKDEVGQLHNGRKGRIVGVRYGDIIIKSTDDIEPTLDGAHYSPFNLEKLIEF